MFEWLLWKNWHEYFIFFSYLFSERVDQNFLCNINHDPCVNVFVMLKQKGNSFLLSWIYYHILLISSRVSWIISAHNDVLLIIITFFQLFSIFHICVYLCDLAIEFYFYTSSSNGKLWQTTLPSMVVSMLFCRINGLMHFHDYCPHLLLLTMIWTPSQVIIWCQFLFFMILQILKINWNLKLIDIGGWCHHFSANIISK